MFGALPNGVARALSTGLEQQASKYTPKSILITGGAGNIASHVAVRLCNEYLKVKMKFFLEALVGSAAGFFNLQQTGQIFQTYSVSRKSRGSHSGSILARVVSDQWQPGICHAGMIWPRWWCWTNWTTAHHCTVWMP